MPHVVDPLGGTYYVEASRIRLAAAATALIDEVEAIGGMTRAVESGLPKLRIEESAARRQARSTGGTRRSSVSTSTSRPTRPRSTCATSTTRRCASGRSCGSRRCCLRDQSRVDAALAALTQTAQSGNGNLGLVGRGDPCPARRSARSPTRSKGCLPATAPRSARSAACTAGRTRIDEGFRRVQREIDAFAGDEGRRPAHAGRQIRPGRARPRREGHRHRVRRHRFRRRHRPVVPDSGGGGPTPSRTTSTSSGCRPMPPHDLVRR